MKNIKQRAETVTTIGSVGVFLLAGAFASSIVLAQENGGRGGAAMTMEPAGADSQPWTIQATGGARYSFNSDLDGAGDGEFSVLRAGAGVSVSRGIFDDARIKFDFSSRYNHFDFSGSNSLIAGTNDPFTDIYQFVLGAGFFDRINDQWGWGVGVAGEFFGESDASFSDASTYMVSGLARYQVNSDLALGFGLMVRSQIEDDTEVLPLVSVDWQIDDSWKLTVGKSEVAWSPRAMLSYDLGNDASIGVGVEYFKDRFRLDDDAIRRSAVIEDTSVPVFVNLTFHPTERATVAVEGGVIAYQEFRVENRAGDNGREFDSDATGFFGVSMSWSF